MEIKEISRIEVTEITYYSQDCLYKLNTDCYYYKIIEDKIFKIFIEEPSNVIWNYLGCMLFNPYIGIDTDFANDFDKVNEKYGYICTKQ